MVRDHDRNAFEAMDRPPHRMQRILAPEEKTCGNLADAEYAVGLDQCDLPFEIRHARMRFLRQGSRFPGGLHFTMFAIYTESVRLRPIAPSQESRYCPAFSDKGTTASVLLSPGSLPNDHEARISPAPRREQPCTLAAQADRVGRSRRSSLPVAASMRGQALRSVS